VLGCSSLGARAAPPAGAILTRGTYSQFAGGQYASPFVFRGSFSGTVVFAGKAFVGTWTVGSAQFEPIGTWDGTTSTVTGPINGRSPLATVTGTCTVSWLGQPLPPYPPTLTYHCFGQVNGGPVGARDILVTLDDPYSYCTSSCNGTSTKKGRYAGSA
ncbi:MAG: hypothetical protein ACRDKG_02750, partial [Actinomycetota bacterium]